MRQTQPPAVRGGGENYPSLSFGRDALGAPSPWESSLPAHSPTCGSQGGSRVRGVSPCTPGWPVSHQRRQASSLCPAGSRAGAGLCRSSCDLQGQVRAGSNGRYKAAGTSPLVARGGGEGPAGTCLANPGTRRLHQSLFCLSCLYGTQSLAPTLRVF